MALLAAAPCAALERVATIAPLPTLPSAAAPAIHTPAIADKPIATYGNYVRTQLPYNPPGANPTDPLERVRGLERIGADPQNVRPRLDGFFDASKAVGAAPQPAAFVAEPAAPGSLLEKAKPWRTENQLARLRDSGRREPGEPFIFSVIGDAEPGRFWIWRALFNHPGVFAKLLAAIGRTNADFVVQLGDMVSRGTAKNYGNFFDLLARVNPLKPYLTVIGNHDRRKPHGVADSRMYHALFGPTNYLFERGGVRFVVLDSSAGRLTHEQLAWLDKALDTPLRKVVMTHMPPTVLRAWTKVPHTPMAGGFKKGAAEFTDIMARRNVERVYMGHVHGFGYLDYKGVRYVLTGGGGSPLFPSNVQERFHHFLTVEVAPDGLIETVHKEDGATFHIPAQPGR